MAKTEDAQKRLSGKQNDFIKIFDQCSCNISIACQKCAISRGTYYKWLENPKFAEKVKNCKESLLDFAETKLHQNVMEGKEASIFFVLKTLGKDRGYIETVEQKVQLTPFEELMKSASLVEETE